MINRRTFINRGATCATALAAVTASNAKQSLYPASSAEAYNHLVPKFKKGSRCLFLGDSITDMKWGRNQADRNHYLGHSYVFLIAARLGVDVPESKIEFFNRGVSGNKVSDLRKRWQKDAVEMRPDWLSILVGVNDISRGERSS